MTMADLLIVCWSPCVVWQRTQHFVGNDTKMTRTEKPWLLAFVGFTDGWNYSHYIHLCSFQIQPDFDKNSELPSQNMGVAGLLQPQSVRLFGVLMYKYTFNRSEWSLRTCSQHKPSEGSLSLPVTELVSAAVWPQSPPGGPPQSSASWCRFTASPCPAWWFCTLTLHICILEEITVDLRPCQNSSDVTLRVSLCVEQWWG